jgi:hypothetical protein
MKLLSLIPRFSRHVFRFCSEGITVEGIPVWTASQNKGNHFIIKISYD